jgi:carbamoyl-phosphate synthase large subunit
MENINILFLGGAKRVSIAERFINEGEKYNIVVKIFSYEIHNKVPIACIGEVIIGLRWNDKKIFNHLKEVIKENKINIILPFVDPAIEVCSLLKKQVGNSIDIPVSSETICRTMFEKKKAATWFEKHNFPIPETYKINNIKLPAIFKPNRGSAAKGLIIVKNESELKKIHKPDEYLIQEFIEENIEYTVDAYVSKNKEVITIVPRIRLETAGGEATRSITTNDEKIIELSSQILLSDEFYGPITIQFIRDSIKDKLYIMEINPRLGGGVILSIEAGANIPEMVIKEYLGLQIEKISNWKPGILMTRYFKEVFYANNN